MHLSHSNFYSFYIFCYFVFLINEAYKRSFLLFTNFFTFITRLNISVIKYNTFSFLYFSNSVYTLTRPCALLLCDSHSASITSFFEICVLLFPLILSRSSCFFRQKFYFISWSSAFYYLSHWDIVIERVLDLN